jgi:predicted ferric reductase
MVEYPVGARQRNLQVAFTLGYLLISVTPCSWWFLYRTKVVGRALLPQIVEFLILAVFPILSLQPVLSARLRVLDRSFGLDTIYILHKIMGMTAVATLIGAVVLQAGEKEGVSQALPGVVAAGLSLVLVLTAFFYRELRIRYESWRRLHNVLAVAALSTLYAHALFITAGYSKTPMRIVLTLYLATGAAAYLWHCLIGPIGRRRNLYRIAHVARETPNVWSLTLEPLEGAARFDFLPGQFQFLTFKQGKGEEHPFTISSSPTLPGVHTATIKESGDFTRGIGMVRPGDLLAVQAPFGRFSYLLYPDEHDIVFIAGGIGITPIMSMLRHMRDSRADKDIELFSANHGEEDIVFRRELEEIAKGEAPRLRVRHVLSKPGPGWTGERGHIDWPLLEKNLSGDLRAKAYYLCGPPTLMNALITTLIDKGIPARQVRSEQFSL